MKTNQNGIGGQGVSANPSSTQSGLQSNLDSLCQGQLGVDLLAELNLEAEDWTRLPLNGERLDGISRSGLYRVMDDPLSEVVSVSLKQRGAERGLRLIGRNSLRRYIARCARQQLKERVATKGGAE